MKALIIGSGIGGLAASIRLKAKGYEVDLFEQSDKTGGKIGMFEQDGFRFDTGPSLLTLPNLLEELFQLAGRKMSAYIDITALPVSCKYFFPDGTQLTAWSEHQKFVDEVAQLGIDRSLVENYLERQSFLYEYTSDFFLFNSIHKISTYVGPSGQKSLKALHRLDAAVSMHRRNQQSFGDKRLTQLFDRYATYNGSDPYRAPATLNMIAHLEHNTGAYFPKNGMRGIVDGLVSLAEEMGIRIHLNEAVRSVLHNGKAVYGIETDKRQYEADIVVNDVDVTYFYRKLLPEKAMYRKLNKRERSSSALIFYWGMQLESKLDVHNILFSNDYEAEFKGVFKTKEFADDLTVYIFISKKVVATDAPNGAENWFVMVNAPENVGQNWESLTAKARQRIIHKIESTLNIDLEKAIVNEKIMTPVDIETRTSSVNGSLYGHSSNSALAAFLRHPNFSRRYKNLYFVGGSVHPGGGIPLCIASAKIVDRLIKKA
jgi:phytoene desaturase